eukprot:10026865-Alexandrium_andersonii.AAC.1
MAPRHLSPGAADRGPPQGPLANAFGGGRGAGADGAGPRASPSDHDGLRPRLLGSGRAGAGARAPGRPGSAHGQSVARAGPQGEVGHLLRNAASYLVPEGRPGPGESEPRRVAPKSTARSRAASRALRAARSARAPREVPAQLAQARAFGRRCELLPGAPQ